MDIWRWLVDYTRDLAAEGDTRLARLLIQIPEATCDDRHAEVDAMVPEALALLRARKHKWAEVYVRHWYLQSKILHRHEVKDNLAEAVSLLAFANEPDTRECPQSVCVTQDLACTYADIDGPGYAAERLAVAAETLTRIDPTWPCFDCISGEYTSALTDDGRVQETLDYIDEQKVRLAEFKIFELGGNLTRRRALALLELGRYEEAKEQLDAWDVESDGGHRWYSKRTIYARCLAKLGLLQEAGEALPEPREIMPTAGLHEGWMQAVSDLLSADVVENTWRLGRVLAHMSLTLEGNGALWATAWSALLCARLAHERGCRPVAERQIQRALTKLSELRKPELLRDQVENLARSIASMPLGALGADDEALAAAAARGDAELILDSCGEDPERDLAALELLFSAQTDGERGSWLDVDSEASDGTGDDLERRRGHLQYCQALRVLGYGDEAQQRLRTAVERNPSDDDALVLLGESLLADNRADEILAILDARVDRALQVASDAEALRVADMTARWLRVQALTMLGEDARCRRTLRGIMTEVGPGDDDGLRAAMHLARMERERGAYEEAMELVEMVQANMDEPGSYDWERMVLGTLLERWDAVRDSAARLGMELPGEGPVELSGGICRIEVADDAGRTQTLVAERTGPVSARILSITAGAESDERERHGDVVVFDAAPMETDENEIDGDGEQILTFRALATARQGEFTSFAIDGVYPGASIWDQLVHGLTELGCTVHRRSGDSYVLDHPDESPTEGEPDREQPDREQPDREQPDESQPDENQPGDSNGANDRAGLPGIYAFVAVPTELDDAQVHDLLAGVSAKWTHPIIWPVLAAQVAGSDELERQRDIARRYRL